MPSKRLLGMIFAAMFAASLYAADVVLNPEHPDRYVVVKGDTLWDISAMFLRDPWLWPEVWYVNPQIANPHLIYPGDILNLVYVDGHPQLRMTRGYPTVDMAPQIREESLANAIPTIPIDAIRPYLTRSLVVSSDELETAPYVVASAGEHVITGVSDRVYVRGIDDKETSVYDIFKPGDPYIDPDTNELLGYEALYLGTGPIEQYGDPSTLFLAETTREIRAGDRLRPAEEASLIASFHPHAPSEELEGHIISVIDGVTQIGQFNVVALDLGTREGVEIGHVFKVLSKGPVIKDHFSGKRNDTVKLPDEEAGLLMVFRSFEKVSFGLIMKATSSIHINDVVRTP